MWCMMLAIKQKAHKNDKEEAGAWCQFYDCACFVHCKITNNKGDVI